jgi:hypothetical protein
MIALLVALLLDGPHPSTTTVRTISFATLTEQQTRGLAGFHCFECRSADPCDGKGIPFMPSEQIGEDEVALFVETERWQYVYDADGEMVRGIWLWGPGGCFRRRRQPLLS